jgi:hypothetical protein
MPIGFTQSLLYFPKYRPPKRAFKLCLIAKKGGGRSLPFQRYYLLLCDGQLPGSNPSTWLGLII